MLDPAIFASFETLKITESFTQLAEVTRLELSYGVMLMKYGAPFIFIGPNSLKLGLHDVDGKSSALTHRV